MKNNSTFRKVGEKAVRMAGEFALGKYNTFNRSEVTVKAHDELLTYVDLESENIIMSEIRKNFSDHHILSEEAGDNKSGSDYLWIIDPIDGTTNFTMHNPLWAVSVGLAYKNEIIFGFIYAPFLDEMFIAEFGKGATLNGKKIKVSNYKSGKVLNTFCSGRDMKFIKKVVDYNSRQRLSEKTAYILGSAALDLAYVASGRVETVFIPGASLWDVAAGILLVREAGGIVTDEKGKNWTIKSEYVLAANKKEHPALLKTVKSL
jgi:myo-inositol-1(or 4)-monophosphatase